MKVIVDTNVLLSSALRDRLPERVVMFVVTQDDWEWIVTPDVVNEYADVLRRPKFKLHDATIAQWNELIVLRTVNIGNPPVTLAFQRDPKDAPILAAALYSRADYLITGDADLLAARGAVPTQIVTVAEFAAKFGLTASSS